MDYNASDTVNNTMDDKAVFAGKLCLMRDKGDELYVEIFVRSIEDGIVSFHYPWAPANCQYADAEEFFAKRDIRLSPSSVHSEAAESESVKADSYDVIVEFTTPTCRGFERTNFTLRTDKVDGWLKKVGSKTSWADIKDSIKGGYRVNLDLSVPSSWNVLSVEMSRIDLPKADDEPNSFVSGRRFGETVSVTQ